MLETAPSVRSICLMVLDQYALNYHLPVRPKTLTETVKEWKSFGDELFPIPHPSPRNNIWLKKHPWFEKNVIPDLRQRVSEAIG